MFEQEIEMEKKSSSFGPLLVIFLLVLVVVGGAGYVLFQSKQTLKPEIAAQVLEDAFKTRGPVTTEFSTGLIGWSTATQPHYTVLEKAGLVSISKPDREARKTIKLTSKGSTEVAAFPEFKPDVDKDGRTTYTIPLATRKLVEVGKITMNGPNMATVEYVWKWEPTTMGDLFDASGKELQSLPSWQRATVIEKHGADYYHSAPTTTTVRLVKSTKGWKVSND
jgi:hypothetical protein